MIVERDGSVTVRAPWKMAARQILEFVEQHAGWVEKKQAELQSISVQPSLKYREGEQLLYLGESYSLQIVPDRGTDLVLADSFQLGESLRDRAEPVVQRWYREQARRVIGERVEHFAKQYQVEYGKIRITSARTRWGSCTTKGNLSFSWRLVMTPLPVIDYVVIHELAHTVHHNHSRQFWDLVERWLPDYREQKKQLRQYAGITM